MKKIPEKSKTDMYWNNRARMEDLDQKVNIGDTCQRELETRFILSVLPAGARVLEVGCGNGHLTRIMRETAGFVDAFDYAENMVRRAKRYAGEKNNRFFCDNVVEPALVEPPYDAVVCVRVLINLRDLRQQTKAIQNMADWLKPGGKLILVEGYRDGFEELDRLRTEVALPPLTPAGINLYSNFDEIRPVLKKFFETSAEFHTGMFDFLTRVVYPLLVGADKVKEAGEFHMKTLPLARAFNPGVFEKFGRLKGLELIKR